MAKNSKNSNNSVLNLSCVIAIILAVVIYILQIICHFTASVEFMAGFVNFISKINGYLTKVKDVLLALVVILCGFRYAGSLSKGGWKTTVYVFCIFFTILLVVGIIIL